MRIDAIILRELHMTLVRPFETSFGITRKRRILLAEIKSEGLTGWGECTAGERPFFSEESTDSAWAAITQELGPMLAAETLEHGGDCPRIFRQVRHNRMAKATLEDAIWDLEAQREGVSLSRLIGGVHDVIPCGVSLGIQASIPELLAQIEKELAAGYQRIKLKCKPGWDVEVFERVRSQLRRQLIVQAQGRRPPDRIRCLRPADDRAAAVARRLLLPLDAAKAIANPHLPGRIDPQPARRSGGHRDGVLPDYQYQAGARGRLLRGHRGPQCGPGAGHSGVVRGDAGIGRGTVA
jgi:hypothetical protein